MLAANYFAKRLAAGVAISLAILALAAGIIVWLYENTRHSVYIAV